ncbi:MAG: hypothetical protein KC502_21760 [Myxococcales bacterium]|nr:hypothetical protein [Myxococcales bacterium]
MNDSSLAKADALWAETVPESQDGPLSGLPLAVLLKLLRAFGLSDDITGLMRSAPRFVSARDWLAAAVSTPWIRPETHAFVQSHALALWQGLLPHRGCLELWHTDALRDVEQPVWRDACARFEAVVALGRLLPRRVQTLDHADRLLGPGSCLAVWLGMQFDGLTQLVSPGDERCQAAAIEAASALMARFSGEEVQTQRDWQLAKLAALWRLGHVEQARSGFEQAIAIAPASIEPERAWLEGLNCQSLVARPTADEVIAALSLLDAAEARPLGQLAKKECAALRRRVLVLQGGRLC